MNDYLSKPIVGAQLNTILSKWLPPDKITIGQEDSSEAEVDDAAVPELKELEEVDEVEEEEIKAESPEEKSPPKGLLGKAGIIEKKAETPDEASEEGQGDDLFAALNKIEGLDTVKGLAYNGDNEEIYRESLKDYCATLDKREDDACHYLETNNWKQYFVLLHAIKGVLAALGMQSLSDDAKELEMAGRKAAEGDEEAMTLCREKNEPAFLKFIFFREDLMATPLSQEEARTQMSRDELKEDLDALTQACNDYVTSEVQRIIRKLKKVTIDPEVDKQLTGVFEAADKLDYDETVWKIDELKKSVLKEAA
jgi:HPt (histidine-containing phosphotransfer) domain-containing protein